MLLSIILFFIITIGLSFIIDFFIDFKANIYEQLFIRIGIGICLFTFLGVVFDLLYIPLNIWIYLALSLFLIIYNIYKYRDYLSFDFLIDYFNDIPKKEHIYFVIIFFLFIITSFMYISGSFSHTYMEDGDSWGYTAVSKVISEEQTFKADYRYNHYSEPYTQGYQILMGVIHQANDSINFTMKFFHNLILALSIIFFYFFVKRLFYNKKYYNEIALFSTFILFAIPSWVGRFIFSLSFNMVLFLIFLYSLIRINEDNSWWIPTSLIYASILINHAYTGVMTTIFLIFYWFLEVIISENLNKGVIKSGVFGGLLSLIFHIPTNLRHSYYFVESFSVETHGGYDKIFFPLVKLLMNPFYLVIFIIISLVLILAYIYSDKWFNKIKIKSINKKKYFLSFSLVLVYLFSFLLPKKLLDVGGSASRVYTFSDFFSVGNHNMINNPLGWGQIITIFTFLSILFILLNYSNLFKKENFNLLFIFFGFFFTFYLVQGSRHTFLFMAFRAWTYMVIFTSILCGFIIYHIHNMISKQNKYISYIILIIVAFFIITTSFIPKYEHNTSVWPEHRIFIPESYPVYNHILKDLPKDQSIVRLCGNSNILATYDAYPPLLNQKISGVWRGEANVPLLQDRYLEMNSSEIYSELNELDVQYIVFGLSCGVKESEEVQNNIVDKMNQLLESNYFQYVQGTQTEILLRLR